MTPEEEKELNVLIKKRSDSILDSISEETEALWKQAKANTQILTGEERVYEGQKVDFSMLDFLLATIKFTPQDMTSDLLMLTKFWSEFYPYLKKLQTGYSHYRGKLRESYASENHTLYGYANQNLELQCFKLFLKELDEETPGLAQRFDKFHKDHKEKSDAEIAKIRKQEKKRVKKEQGKIKHLQAIEKQKAFESKLRI